MPRQYRKDALIIFCLLAFVYAYFYQDASSNGNSRYGLIFAIVQEGRLSIDTYLHRTKTDTSDKSYFNGHYYSDKAIGPSLVGAVVYTPLYWINKTFNRISETRAKYILTFMVIGLPSAIAGSLIYILCLYMSGSRFRAYSVTMAITLGTMYFPYSVIFFSHQFASSLLFSAFFMILFLKEKPEKWKNWYFILIGLLLGWALISEYPTVLIILGLLCYYFSVVWRNHACHHFRSIILPMLGWAIPVILQLIYNKLCFGNFFSMGYSNLEDPYFIAAMEQGLMGIHWPNLSVLFYMTFHPTMGLFWQSPVLLLSFIGASIIFREQRYRYEALLAIWIICSYLIIMSGYFMWWGGWALGPRHIIPVLPYFSILLVFSQKRLTWLFVILSIVSIGQMMIAAASNVLIPDIMALKISTLGFFEYSNIYTYCLNELITGHFAWNLGQFFFGLENWVSLLPLALVVSGLSLIMAFFPTRWDHNQRNQAGRLAS